MSIRAWTSRGLYAITDAALLPGDRLFDAVREAIQGGAVLVQYRDKNADEPTRYERARRLLQICNELDCPLLINDDLELAVSLGAPGVHLGRTDGSIALARKRLGPEAIIGATCHASIDFAHEAKREGASYVAFGSCFPSPTKPNAERAPRDLITQAKQEIGLPITAIGGITLANAPELIDAGADLLAVINGLFAAPDVTRRASDFVKLFA